MTTFIETLINGLAVGSLYALIALGYTMVYGILKFINFAHSDIFVVGAWMSLTIAVAAGWTTEQPPVPPAWLMNGLYAVGIVGVAAALLRFVSQGQPAGNLLGRIGTSEHTIIVLIAAIGAWLVFGLFLAARGLKSSGWDLLGGGLVLIAAMLSSGLLGLLIERFAYKPLRSAPRLNVLITAIGVSLLLQNTGQLKWLFGPSPRNMPALLPDAVLGNVAGVPVRLVDVIGASTAVLLMLVLEWLVFRTKLGRAMRAVSYNHNTAALMGVPVDRVISFTFVTGAMLAAAAGFLYAMKYPGLNQPAYSTWVLLGLKAFVAAVVGGIGNIRGAMLGGIFIGLIEFFGVRYVSTDYRDVYVFAILILVLLFRPSGLLGKAVVEKV